MKYHKEKEESIRQYILSMILKHETGIAKKTASVFDISEMTVYRYLRHMLDEKIIFKEASTYHLSEVSKIFSLDTNEAKELSEDKVFSKFIAPEIQDLPDNIRNIWEYCFSEMMNNVIDHSVSTEVMIRFIRDYMSTKIIIEDNGIGLFRKIKEYFGFSDYEDVLAELFKGKLTTDSDNHSGEGIFFTSRIMDEFSIISDEMVFSLDNSSELTDNVESVSKEKDNRGTLVSMKLSNHTNKTSKSIFDLYADIDGGFIKTRIPIKSIYDTYPVSRSQAKRLIRRFDEFREVELDFDGVKEIGQGFAHELFSVYAKKHPETRLTSINANDDISRMIHHVTH